MQLLGGSPLESLYPSSYGEATLHSTYSRGTIELPPAAPLQLHGHSQQPQAMPLLTPSAHITPFPAPAHCDLLCNGYQSCGVNQQACTISRC